MAQFLGALVEEELLCTASDQLGIVTLRLELEVCIDIETLKRYAAMPFTLSIVAICLSDVHHDGRP